LLFIDFLSDLALSKLKSLISLRFLLLQVPLLSLPEPLTIRFFLLTPFEYFINLGGFVPADLLLIFSHSLPSLFVIDQQTRPLRTKRGLHRRSENPLRFESGCALGGAKLSFLPSRQLCKAAGASQGQLVGSLLQILGEITRLQNVVDFLNLQSLSLNFFILEVAGFLVG